MSSRSKRHYSTLTCTIITKFIVSNSYKIGTFLSFLVVFKEFHVLTAKDGLPQHLEMYHDLYHRTFGKAD